MAKTRNINCELLIDAAPAAVWAALTEADEIARWFAPYVRAQPGVGGHIDLSWDGDFTQPCVIQKWQPAELLRMSWYAGPDGNTELPVEIHLAPEGAGTRLKLVHYGFLSDASWDEEYDSHTRGWTYELRSLRLYLEQFIGRGRAFVHRRFPVTGDYAETWRTLIGSRGLFAPDRAGLAEGDAFTVRLPDGRETAARLVVSLADKDFAFVADVLDGGVFRFAFETFTGQPEIWIWAFSWTLAEQQLEKIATPLLDAVSERLGRQARSTA